ncbi:MAG: hypothetical protein WDA21_02855 [Bacilli bacterium]
MKFIKKQKSKILIGILLLIIGISVIFLIKAFVYPSNGPIYGNRLNGIDDVEIKDNRITEIESSILHNDKVKEVEVLLQGKLINIFIDVDNIDADEAKKILNDTLDDFSAGEKDFYDFQYFITNNSDKDSEIYPIIGYKSKLSDIISWSE